MATLMPDALGLVFEGRPPLPVLLLLLLTSEETVTPCFAAAQ